MLANDRVYETIRVNDPLLKRLIATPQMQRLKFISQDGATHFVDPAWKGTRFEHCLGTWYLSSQFDVPLPLQVACLLHDVSHTAFSHVVDFALGDTTQTYHESLFERLVVNSEIPGICTDHGVDFSEVLECMAHPLLDGPTPTLTFDRWDCFMRDAVMLRYLTTESVRQIIATVKLRDGLMYFSDLGDALKLCQASLAVCMFGYVSPASHGSWFLLANAIKAGLQQGVIYPDDLLKTDDYVMNALRTVRREEIAFYLDRLNPSTYFVRTVLAEAEFYGPNKARFIDPLVLHDGRLRPVSEIVGLTEFIGWLKQHCAYVGVKQSPEPI